MEVTTKAIIDVLCGVEGNLMELLKEKAKDKYVGLAGAHDRLELVQTALAEVQAATTHLLMLG